MEFKDFHLRWIKEEELTALRARIPTYKGWRKGELRCINSLILHILRDWLAKNK